jgi:hypothetical protein
MLRSLIWLSFILSILVSSQYRVIAQDSARPESYHLNMSHLRFEWQQWNNCGPTNITMGLSYFGYDQKQDPAARFLKPHIEDRNVNPEQMVSFVNEVASVDYGLDVKAFYTVGGDLETLKTLLAADFPVIIEEGYEPPDHDWSGHYLLLTGYDDTQALFYAYDSFRGSGGYYGREEAYDKVSNYWWQFSNTFIVLYPPARESEVMVILGDLAEPTQAYERVFTLAQERANLEPEVVWHWFNMGDALTHLGYYVEATNFFRVALDLGVDQRLLWYRHTPLEAYYRSGKFKDLAVLLQNVKLTTPYVEEFYYYTGLMLASQGQLDDARAQFEEALFYNQNDHLSVKALEALEAGTFEGVAQTD